MVSPSVRAASLSVDTRVRPLLIKLEDNLTKAVREIKVDQIIWIIFVMYKYLLNVYILCIYV